MTINILFQALVLISSFGLLIAAIQYIRLMFRGKVKPNRITWLMWSITPFIAAYAEIISHVGLATLPVFMNGACPLLVFLSSFATKKAYWKLTKSDYVCGFLSLLAILLWYMTKAPSIAILFAILGDGFAAIPTVKKAWFHPKTESFEPYLMSLLSGATAFGVITKWTFSAYAFPAYLVFIYTLTLFGLYRNRISRKKL